MKAPLGGGFSINYLTFLKKDTTLIYIHNYQSSPLYQTEECGKEEILSNQRDASKEAGLLAIIAKERGTLLTYCLSHSFHSCILATRRDFDALTLEN